MITDTPEQYAKRTATLAAKYLNVAKEAALAAGVSCETMHVEHDHPYVAIIDTAAQKLCDLIVMASHGRRGISAIVLGSETVKVLTHSTIPVLVFRAHHGFSSGREPHLRIVRDARILGKRSIPLFVKRVKGARLMEDRRHAGNVSLHSYPRCARAILI